MLVFLVEQSIVYLVSQLQQKKCPPYLVTNGFHTMFIPFGQLEQRNFCSIMLLMDHTQLTLVGMFGNIGVI